MQVDCVQINKLLYPPAPPQTFYKNVKMFVMKQIFRCFNISLNNIYNVFEVTVLYSFVSVKYIIETIKIISYW